jgi:hypothetical protein
MRDRRINNLPIFLARVAEVGLEGSGQAQRKTVLRLARDCGEAWLGEPVDGRGLSNLAWHHGNFGSIHVIMNHDVHNPKSVDVPLFGSA